MWGGAGRVLLLNLAFRQRRLKFSDVSIGDFGVFESNLLLPWLSLSSSVRYGGALDSPGARPPRA